MQALVVDDSRAMRRILKGIVTGLGFEPVEAENGKVAFEFLQSSSDIPLALVDWNMPVMNGLELVKAIRADKKWENLRIVMVTTETEPARMAQALMAGVDEFVMKPFTKDSLVEKLKLIGVKMPNAVSAR